jgi:hypothetical protein
MDLGGAWSSVLKTDGFGENFFGKAASWRQLYVGCKFRAPVLRRSKIYVAFLL